MSYFKDWIKLKTTNIDVVFFLLVGIASTFVFNKLNAILVFLLFGFQFFYILKKREIKLETTLYFWGLILFFALSFFGLIYTDNLSRGFDIIGRQISFLLFPLFYTTYKTRNISLLLKIYCVAIFGLIILFEVDTVYRFFYRSDTFPLTLDLFLSYRFTGVNLTKLLPIHNSYLAMYVMFSNVIIFHLITKTKNLFTVLGLFLLIWLQSIFIFQMVAKTAIILNTLILVISIIYVLIKHKKYKVLLISVFSTIIMLWFSYSYLNYPIKRISDRFTELCEGEMAKRETRIKLWNSALPIIKNNYFFGVGTGDVEGVLHDAYKRNGISSTSNVHNQYLDYTLRFGLVGLIFFLSILGGALVYAVNVGNYIYFCFTIIIMGCCFTENIFNRQWGIIFYAYFNYLLFVFVKEN
ncbi:O-antigen ligase family protein [Flagellimonas pacifica]|uniref:O-Antigen ligase n=1 Tax=Flagellimonas pacifica TaxID=1247520 RepID=A0A285MEY1_9FLAO|nr:O-antigen ligase family protein [Allomuricauda parva]SNY95027.1 O-Antigen ligase [Allomuricauda parva]